MMSSLSLMVLKMKNYSDDNCCCQAEQVSINCPRHKHLFKVEDFDC